MKFFSPALLVLLSVTCPSLAFAKAKNDPCDNTRPINITNNRSELVDNATTALTSDGFTVFGIEKTGNYGFIFSRGDSGEFCYRFEYSITKKAGSECLTAQNPKVVIESPDHKSGLLEVSRVSKGSVELRWNESKRPGEFKRSDDYLVISNSGKTVKAVSYDSKGRMKGSLERVYAKDTQSMWRTERHLVNLFDGNEQIFNNCDNTLVKRTQSTTESPSREASPKAESAN